MAATPAPAAAILSPSSAMAATALKVRLTVSFFVTESGRQVIVVAAPGAIFGGVAVQALVILVLRLVSLATPAASTGLLLMLVLALMLSVALLPLSRAGKTILLAGVILAPSVVALISLASGVLVTFAFVAALRLFLVLALLLLLLIAGLVVVSFLVPVLVSPVLSLVLASSSLLLFAVLCLAFTFSIISIGSRAIRYWFAAARSLSLLLVLLGSIFCLFRLLLLPAVVATAGLGAAALLRD